MWVCSTLSQESPAKISAKTDNRAKSYARFTEGGSESVFQKPESVRGRVWNRVRFFLAAWMQQKVEIVGIGPGC